MVEPNQQQRLDVVGKVTTAIDAAKPVAAQHSGGASGVATGEVGAGERPISSAIWPKRGSAASESSQSE